MYNNAGRTQQQVAFAFICTSATLRSAPRGREKHHKKNALASQRHTESILQPSSQSFFPVSLHYFHFLLNTA